MTWSDLERYGVWPGEMSRREEKEEVAERVARRARDGEVIGVGSGSTAFLAVLALGRRVATERLRLTGIPTSIEVGLACAAAGIPTATLLERRPDWGFDGADEIDPRGNLIKGRGGALLAEKLVMTASPLTVILGDASKRVERLGERFPVPVEIVPEALHLVRERLVAAGASEVRLRPAGDGKDGPVLTERRHLLLDASFPAIEDALEREIKTIPGVVESGLFVGYPVEVVTPSSP